MDSNLIALKLFLDDLGVSADIETIDDRKRVQKAVYLGQAAGADLGYRFGWYLLGPYSPSLTKDYFRLAEAFLSGDKNYKDKILNKRFRAILHRVKSLFKVPKGIDLPKEDWLELLSSVHYLRRVRNESRAETVRTIKSEKPRLHQFISEAEKKLASVGLLT